MGVLDIGSNTVHLLVANAHPGGRPTATTSDRTVVRLMRFLAADGSITEAGIEELEAAVARAVEIARNESVDALLATATSAVREATNGQEVIRRIEDVLGQKLHVLDGHAESELTYLAVRRWFGWAAGRILLLDIGGGSFELAAGVEETPELATSIALGAGRMTLQYFPEDPPGLEAVEALRAHARDVLAPVAAQFRALPTPDHIVGSSKAIRSLATLAGRYVASVPSYDRIELGKNELDAWIPRLARIPATARQELPGITPDRTYQIVAAAVVLHTAMHLLGVEVLEVSPWALREGVLLRYIESLPWQGDDSLSAAAS